MMPWALVFALANAGNNRPARIAMMAMTTSSSIKVKPALRAGLPTRDVRESFIIFRSVSYLGHEKHSESQLKCNCAFHRPPLCGRKHSAENGFLWPLRGSDSQCRNPGLTSWADLCRCSAATCGCSQKLIYAHSSNDWRLKS